MISEITFTSDTVETFIWSTSSASIQDPEVSIIAVALTVLKISVDSTILITAAFSIDDSVSGVTDTAFGSLVPMRVKRTVFRIFTFSFINRHTVGAHALSIDIGSSSGAKRFTVTSIFSISWLAKTFI